MIAGSAYGQSYYQMQENGPLVEVLSQESFEARFGDNIHIPRNERAIIALAEKLYPSLWDKMKPAAPLEEITEEITEDCGEENVGILFAALQNPEISDSTRRIVSEIMAAAIPPLPKTKTSASGHFKIWYTTNNADPIHNVTDPQIENLATLLDSYWNKYTTSFKEPKHKIVSGKKRIDVKVYYISASTLGQTASGWDHIELNSATCVRDACKRRTTSAHELFHRVQYAYGYISGTANSRWIVEGTAAWSQKFTNSSIRDYMARMNSGLNSPGTSLITGRSYDACHFWVYLQEQTSSSAIKQVWAKYQVNGLKAKEAVGSVTTARLGLNFDKYTTKWSKANYIKDLANAKSGGYDYDDNAVTKISCGVTYGPLRKVPVTTGTINPNSSFTQSGSVNPYGAKYHVFTLGKTLKNLSVNFKGTGSFELAFIGIKNNQWKSITNKTLTSYNYKKTLTAGQWDKLAVMVMGTTKGGNYSLKVGGCITGTWTDSYSKTWVLNEAGTTITGTRDAISVGCGLTKATGTYNPPNITLNTNIVVSGCCSVRWTGTVTGCNTISGTWTQTGGGAGCNGSGSFSMSKKSSASQVSEFAIESEGDPSCGTCN